jgi:DNA repair exonuclease SbcCD ATPase subunit
MLTTKEVKEAVCAATARNQHRDRIDEANYRDDLRKIQEQCPHSGKRDWLRGAENHTRCTLCYKEFLGRTNKEVKEALGEANKIFTKRLEEANTELSLAIAEIQDSCAHTMFPGADDVPSGEVCPVCGKEFP